MKLIVRNQRNRLNGGIAGFSVKFCFAATLHYFEYFLVNFIFLWLMGFMNSLYRSFCRRFVLLKVTCKFPK